MPRDGSNIYHQPFPNVVTDTPIESAVYNGFTNDVASDLNLPRPISAGGTGASDAATAITNLGGEAAKQAVSNYNSFPFVNGSFTSLAGATGAPTANAFFGIYYENANGSYASMQARDQTTGWLYTKRKIANVWDASWGGESFGGNSSINGADASFYINKLASGQNSAVFGLLAAKTRWYLALGNAAAETGGNAGSNFIIDRYDDAGGFLATAMYINRANGLTNFYNQLIINGTDYNAALKLNDTGTGFNKIIRQSPAADQLEIVNTAGSVVIATLTNAGSYNVVGNITANGNASFDGGTIFLSGKLAIATDSSYTIVYDADNRANLFLGGAATSNINRYRNSIHSFETVGGGAQLAQLDNNVMTFNRRIVTPADGAGLFAITLGNAAGAATLNVVAGIPSGAGQHNIYMMHIGGVWFGYQFSIVGSSDFQFRHDSSAYKSGGSTAWQIISDARIKTVREEYTAGLDAVAALRPVRYVYKGNSSLSAPSAGDRSELSPEAAALNDKAAAQEFVGLVAQEAEISMPDMIKQEVGYIDGKQVSDLRSLDTTPLIFALVNAVKELKAKVEALEAR